MSALTSGAIEIRDRLQAENIYQECFVGTTFFYCLIDPNGNQTSFRVAGYEACSAFIQAKFVKTRPEVGISRIFLDLFFSGWQSFFFLLQAVQLGMVLMKNGLIEHCTKSSVFEDGFVFYKLTVTFCDTDLLTGVQEQ